MVKSDFLARLAEGEVLVADGATGTNLQKRGLPVGAAAELWVLENPSAVLDLGKDFVAAGSQVLLTCTFGATRLRLEASGLGDQFDFINRQAVDLARQAIGQQAVFLAGSIGPLGHMLEPFGDVAVDDAEKTFEDQAQVLVDAGVDLIVVETQFDINEAQAAVRAVRKVSRDLPLVCSFSYDRGKRTMMGVSPAAMAEAMAGLDVDVFGINCGRSLAENLDNLQQLRSVTDKPLWFKPNAGMPEMDNDGKPTYSVSPQEMGALVPHWLEAGAQVVGGCCGTSPEHLAEIARAARS
jgi:5-methyltetrahydrofolate--homocysteine methyltransferase